LYFPWHNNPRQATPIPGPICQWLCILQLRQSSEALPSNCYFPKLKVEFLGEAELFLGMKFYWTHSSKGDVTCHISQEGYASLCPSRGNGTVYGQQKSPHDSFLIRASS
jgi:hypothetical protein